MIQIYSSKQLGVKCWLQSIWKYRSAFKDAISEKIFPIYSDTSGPSSSLQKIGFWHSFLQYYAALCINRALSACHDCSCCSTRFHNWISKWISADPRFVSARKSALALSFDLSTSDRDTPDKLWRICGVWNRLIECGRPFPTYSQSSSRHTNHRSKNTSSFLNVFLNMSALRGRDATTTYAQPLLVIFFFHILSSNTLPQLLNAIYSQVSDSCGTNKQSYTSTHISDLF